MNGEEVAKVYGYAKLVDHRAVDPVIVAHWMKLLGDLDYDDACNAVYIHQRTSTEYLQPAHIQAGARKLRERRERRERPRAITDGPPTFARTEQQQAQVSARVAWLRDQYREARQEALARRSQESDP